MLHAKSGKDLLNYKDLLKITQLHDTRTKQYRSIRHVDPTALGHSIMINTVCQLHGTRSFQYRSIRYVDYMLLDHFSTDKYGMLITWYSII